MWYYSNIPSGNRTWQWEIPYKCIFVGWLSWVLLLGPWDGTVRSCCLKFLSTPCPSWVGSQLGVQYSGSPHQPRQGYGKFVESSWSNPKHSPIHPPFSTEPTIQISKPFDLIWIGYVFFFISIPQMNGSYTTPQALAHTPDPCQVRFVECNPHITRDGWTKVDLKSLLVGGSHGMCCFTTPAGLT